MAYVRKRGNQLAVVHGTRNKDTGKVEQQILFTIYSKAEALHILGRNGREKEAEEFKGLLRKRYPDIKFNWRKLLKGIEDEMGSLPDLYEYKESRLMAGFKEDLGGFLKRLVEADPANASGTPLFEYVQELRFVGKVLAERLASLETHGQRHGSRFFWSEALTAPSVPPEVESLAIEAYEEGDLHLAGAAFKLLTDTYPGYAAGHCYQGRVALAAGNVEGAADLFELARQTAYGNLRSRKAERTLPIWDDDILALVEATVDLAQLHCRRQDFERALALATELETQCMDTVGADQIRAEVHLNLGEWEQAADAAVRASTTQPEWSALAAFAVYEMGDILEAATFFIKGLMNRPELATALLAERMPHDGPRRAPAWTARASRLADRLSPFKDHWPRRSQAFFHNLFRFAAKEGVLEQLADSLEARRKAGGLEAHRADEDVKWLRSSLFADKLARAFLHPEEPDSHPAATTHEEPPELMIPGRCSVDSPPLELAKACTEAPLLPVPMNVHATLLPLSLLEYWMARVGVFHSLVSRDTANTMPPDVPALVFKGNSKAARSCNELLRGVDCVTIREAEDGSTKIIGFDQGTPRGTLAAVAKDVDSRGQLDSLLEAAKQWDNRLLLIFSAGGTRQQRNIVRVWDLAGAREAKLSYDAREHPANTGGSPRTADSWSLYGTFDIELAGVEPRVWRRLQLRLDGTLQDLHDAIQGACGWEDRHLFEFRWGENLGQEVFAASDVEWDLEEPPPDATHVPLRDVLRSHKFVTFWYTYDLGDCWTHKVTLTQVTELPDTFRRKLLDGDRSFPPEDCGGLEGFQECVAVALGAYSESDLAEDADLRARRTWLGTWRPDGFDVRMFAREFGK